MSETFVVNAEPRSLQGKGASRRLRREGKVPAILYGADTPPQSIAVQRNDLSKHLETEAFYSHILEINLDGKSEQAVLKDMQRHPVRGDEILHLDLLRVRANQALRVIVPLHFNGGDTCPGVKTGGGNIEHHLTQVEVECLPKDLPEFIDVDLSQLQVGDAVHLSDLALAEGVTLMTIKHGNDAPVASVYLPRVVVESDEEAAAPAADAETPAPDANAAGEGEDKK